VAAGPVGDLSGGLAEEALQGEQGGVGEGADGVQAAPVRRVAVAGPMPGRAWTGRELRKAVITSGVGSMMVVRPGGVASAAMAAIRIEVPPPMVVWVPYMAAARRAMSWARSRGCGRST
jgi:hypothetical protein